MSNVLAPQLQIPVIDFHAFVTGDAVAQQTIAKEIFQACHEIGFLYLKNHGMSQELRDRVFAQSQWFFHLPVEVKRQLAWSSEFSNRGYVGIERERLNPTQPGDLKEAFNVGKEKAAASPNPDDPALTQNRWLPEDDGFRETVLEFFEACAEIADRVFRAFALALDLPESFLADKHRNQSHTLRLLHYPPMAQTPKPGQIRAGEHSDYGTLTLLFQDDMGGLEVKTAAGEWIMAPCIPDTVLINTGDLMQRWSNDVFCSTKHRVATPTGDRAYQSRYSIAFFCHPDRDTEIVCLETCQNADNPPRYAPVLAGEYLISLLQATY
jgi:isopenicillin N synthase-like dioxygenase